MRATEGLVQLSALQNAIALRKADATLGASVKNQLLNKKHMDIINYDNFYKLKLADFVRNKEDVEKLDDWEFMNAIWNGESIGFTEWLQLTDGPEEKSISLDLNDLVDSSIDKIFSTLKLNLTKGMTKENVLAQFGEPKNTESFVEDRVTFEYIIGSKEKYYLSLTITDDSGLTYVVLMNHQDTIKNLEENASY